MIKSIPANLEVFPIWESSVYFLYDHQKAPFYGGSPLFYYLCYYAFDDRISVKQLCFLSVKPTEHLIYENFERIGNLSLKALRTPCDG